VLSKQPSLLGAALIIASITCAIAAEPLRQLSVDASQSHSVIRSLQGVDGLPMGADAGALGILDGPDLRSAWRAAHVDAVRTYIWHARLDTVNNAASLFPNWAADSDNPASYNFALADAAVRASREIGAEILFTIASSIPQNTRPPAELGKWGDVVRHIVLHYNKGWANGFTNAVRYWEIGDEPDLNTFHFSGTPEQFYAMYEAAAHAVKSVDAQLQVGGPGLAFPLNESAPFREGFLSFVQSHSLPFDFFSWKWYSDATEDPWDIPRVSVTTTKVLTEHGLAKTPQFITNWNFDAIPTARPDDLTRAAYESAALTYMQSTILARAFIFRGDAAMGSPKDPDADKTTRMFNADGTPLKSALAFTAVGRMLDTPERLTVTGSDDNGFAVLAGRNSARDEVQVLITNYAISPHFLAPTDVKSLDFDLPIAATRVHVSMALPPRRTEATAKNNGGYDLRITGLPWGSSKFTVERYRIDHAHELTLVDSEAGRGTNARVSAVLPPPSVDLIVIRRVSH
jgi:xylan 1,4-beta-xylosidase